MRSSQALIVGVLAIMMLVEARYLNTTFTSSAVGRLPPGRSAASVDSWPGNITNITIPGNATLGEIPLSEDRNYANVGVPKHGNWNYTVEAPRARNGTLNTPLWDTNNVTTPSLNNETALTNQTMTDNTPQSQLNGTLSSPPFHNSTSAIYWTVSSFQRRCTREQTHCTYGFELQQHANTTAHRCSFTVTASPGEPAYRSSFEGQMCKEPGAKYLRIGSSWNPQGFITVSLKDIAAKHVAFFGFTDDDLNTKATDNEVHGSSGMPSQYVEVHRLPETSNIPNVEESVTWSITTPTTIPKPPTAVPVPEGTMRTMDDGLKLVDAPSWKVSNFARYPVNNKLLVGFLLSSGHDGAQYYYIACALTLDIPPDTPSWKMSFYDVKCSESQPWHISWGYDEARDAAVLTVVNPERTRTAWFGWNKVNDSWALPDRGPNETIQVN